MKIKNLAYSSREERMAFLARDYQKYLSGSILDVGCDQRYLKKYISEDKKYMGIDVSGNPDKKINLEKEKIPFGDNEFDTVICLDVLEHLDNMHDVIEQMINISKKYIIISLPNCWGAMKLSFLSLQSPKFYRLRAKKSPDRHKWFFNIEDIKIFTEEISAEKNLQITEMDIIIPTFNNVFKIIFTKIIKFLFPKHYLNFFGNSVWIVLEKK